MAGVSFEWDDDKAARNQRKHGISFEEALSVFGDARALTFATPTTHYTKTEAAPADCRTRVGSLSSSTPNERAAFASSAPERQPVMKARASAKSDELAIPELSCSP